MIDTISYRGPDARKAEVLGAGVGLAHARLAILDLRPESNQPFASSNGRYVISFNGEIYNYLELRRTLESFGHRFRTTSDTEVLLAGFEQWNSAVVERLNGMWAFAIYDRTTDELFCSRDRFGVKPLYYAHHGGRFLFASEIKAILSVAPHLARPNLEMFSRFFKSSAHSEASSTFFESIYRLEPAHNMTVKRTGTSVHRYWDYPNDSLGLSHEDAVAKLRELLTDSIRLRIRSDVPVGSTLSGGLDSSAIVCLLRTLQSEPHQTFTAAFPGESFDEAPQASGLARSLGMSPHVIPVDLSSVPSLLPTIVYHLDAPTQSPAVLPLWNIMSEMRGRVVVALDGQGADELLGGYIDRVFLYSVIDLLRRGKLRQAAGDMRQHAHTWGPWATVSYPIHEMLPWARKLYRRIRGDGSVYAELLKDQPEGLPVRHDAPRCSDAVNGMLLRQHEGTLRTLLHYGDAISMAHSIEARMPFLDYRLVELCFRLPGALKVSGAQGKVLLREAMSGVVPDAVLGVRRKLGFATPLARWLRERPEELLYPVLYSEQCRRRGLFDPGALRAAIERHVAGQVDLSNQIFRWLTAELWFGQFIDAKPCATAWTTSGKP